MAFGTLVCPMYFCFFLFFLVVFFIFGFGPPVQLYPECTLPFLMSLCWCSGEFDVLRSLPWIVVTTVHNRYLHNFAVFFGKLLGAHLHVNSDRMKRLYSYEVKTCKKFKREVCTQNNNLCVLRRYVQRGKNTSLV